MSALDIDCRGERLVGVLHEGAPEARLALLVVVGGGQYRVGAHRLFVQLARALAGQGVPVLRFDVRGMGDSDGEARHFLDLNDDLRAAIDALSAARSIEGVVLWGLCDGATASILYAPRDRRVRGVVLVNPWISTEEGVARTYLRHHYAARLRDPRFWRRVGSGRVNVLDALRSLAATLWRLLERERGASGASVPESLPDAVFGALAAFEGAALAVISDDDMTAREFDDELTSRTRAGSFPRGRDLSLERVTSDHTFSSPDARARLYASTSAWVATLAAALTKALP